MADDPKKPLRTSGASAVPAAAVPAPEPVKEKRRWFERLAESRGERMGAKCPKCHSMLSRVVKTAGNLGYVRRRRECVHCGERFTTYED
jgi:hypothetical protein